MRRSPWLYLLFLLAVSLGTLPLAFAQPAVEICDNGKDDDGDGLIDLNDGDCACAIVEPTSLIPNPSFEDQSCCPSFRAQMGCANEWIQASEPTTDYLHTCGWMGWDNLPPPLPFPDGDGCLGFRNGRFSSDPDRSNANWKEYAGACLISPLRAGTRYKFQFNIGFTHAVNSPPTTIAFFGSTSCDNLPFGINNEYHGCPTNGQGWVQLGYIRVNGANKWLQTEINVQPGQDIYAMAIGPDCYEAIATEDIYYFFDNLLLAEQSAFEFDIKEVGHPCADDLTLEIPYQDTLNYQWYLEGIALVGETQFQLSQLYGDGNYQVRLVGPSQSCRVTAKYRYLREEILDLQQLTICEGEDYWFRGSYLSQPGAYSDTFKTAENCDSIVRLELRVNRDEPDTLQAKVFPGEKFEIGNTHFFYNPGEYDVRLFTEAGCDSTIFLQLEHYQLFTPNAFTPNDDGINDYFSIAGGPDLLAIEEFAVFNRWGKLMYSNGALVPGDLNHGWDGFGQGGGKAPEGVYVFLATLRYNDGKTRQSTGSFTLFR